MKHARIAWAGAVHDAIERDGRLELLTPGFAPLTHSLIEEQA